jgi:DNA repair protein RadC
LFLKYGNNAYIYKMEYDEKNYTIKQLSEDDRPREKLVRQGRQSLSNAELLAILISSGNDRETAIELSQRILLDCRNNLVDLGRMEVEALCRFRGIGQAKAITIIAALELGRRRQLSEAEDRVQIKSSKDIFDQMEPVLADLPVEEFWIIHLNRGNKVMARERMSQGGVSGTVVDIKLIMRNALQRLSSALILVHNHPSGTMQPSNADIQLTRKVKQAAEIMDIRLLDHLIVADKGYYSFADEGML